MSEPERDWQEVRRERLAAWRARPRYTRQERLELAWLCLRWVGGTVAASAVIWVLTGWLWTVPLVAIGVGLGLSEQVKR